MKPLAILGILLVLFGMVALIAGGFTYTKDRDHAELGPIDVTVTQKEHVRVPTPLSVGAIVVGLAFVVLGGRRRSV